MMGKYTKLTPITYLSVLCCGIEAVAWASSKRPLFLVRHSSIWSLISRSVISGSSFLLQTGHFGTSSLCTSGLASGASWAREEEVVVGAVSGTSSTLKRVRLASGCFCRDILERRSLLSLGDTFLGACLAFSGVVLAC